MYTWIPYLPKQINNSKIDKNLFDMMILKVKYGTTIADALTILFTISKYINPLRTCDCVLTLFS